MQRSSGAATRHSTRPDIETLSEILGENVVWHTPGRSPIAGDYRGRDAVFGQFGRYGGETAGTFRADLKRVLTDQEGRVIGIHHNVGVRNGKRLDVYCCVVFVVGGEGGRRPRVLLRAWSVGRVLVLAPSSGQAGRPHRRSPGGRERVPPRGRLALSSAASVGALERPRAGRGGPYGGRGRPPGKPISAQPGRLA